MKKILLSSLCALLGSLAVFAGGRTAPSYFLDADDNFEDRGFWWGGEVLAGAIANELAVYAPIQAQVIAGYRFNEFFQIGAGVGVRYYATNAYRASRSGIAIPLFLDLRGAILSGDSRFVVPCWSLDFGYTFYDGLMLSPMIGLRLGESERHHFIVGIAYLGQRSNFNVEGIALNGILHGAVLKLAYQF